MASRFVSPRSSATLVPVWVTREETFALGEDCAVAEVREDGGASQAACGSFSPAEREEDEERMERGDRKKEGVWAQQEVQMRDVINPRVPFPGCLPFLWCLFPSCHFSWFQPPAPARLWTLPSIHSPIIPLHLSFTLLLFSTSPSIIHTHGAPGLWLSAASRELLLSWRLFQITVFNDKD